MDGSGLKMRFHVICGMRGMCVVLQAEDGIRDLTVTGVQTCALPISFPSSAAHVLPDEPANTTSVCSTCERRTRATARGRFRPIIFSSDASNAISRQHPGSVRSEEHTSELQSQSNLVCRLLLEKKNNH